jgi:copper resistance protein D
MNSFIPFAEFLNYVFFSLLVGHVILQYIPDSKKPRVHIPRKWLLVMPLGIILFSFGPTLYVINYFAEDFGFGHTTYLVLTQFNVGKGWIFTSVVSLLLWVTLFFRGSKHLQALWLLLLIGSVGYASHVASLSFWSGFFLHTVHFLVVCVWVGILLQVSWFSKKSNNWSSFLKWFSPVAIGCLAVLFISGILIMFKVVEPNEYLNSWAIPYGQMLLLKHISIIPVLTFAVINGILAKKAAIDPSFQSRTWVRAESLLLLVVFFFTSRLGTLSPPHETVETAVWVEKLMGENLKAPFVLHLEPSLIGMSFVCLSVLFLVLMVLIFKKSMSSVYSLIFSTGFIIFCYLGLMLGLERQ